MLIKLPRMRRQEIEKVLRDQILCRIAFKGAEYPYIAPFQYAYMNGSLYFHFTDYGRKMNMLKEDNRVCVEIEKLVPDLSEYHFVSLRGRLRVVEDPEERKKAIKRMVEEGKKRLSTNFLAAHGLESEEGWASFTPEKPILILKLDVVEETGLKSP